MNNKPQMPLDLSPVASSSHPLDINRNASCELDAASHCITCSDETLIATVLRVDALTGLASVTIEDALDEVDITLLDEVTEGDLLLVHGGVAIANTGKTSAEASDA